MAGIVMNEREFIARMNLHERLIQRNYSRRLERIVHFCMESVLARTPVFTGQTVRNWRWSMDAPHGGVLPALGGGQPGETSQMPLGSEPRRGPNEDDARATMKGLSFGRPYRRFWLVNNAPNVAALEAGLLPDADRSRAPQGMLGITLTELESRLAAGGFR